MKLYEKYRTLLSNKGINTPLRLAHFMAQIEHESGLKPISENLNYSKNGLLKTFPKYFTKDTVKIDPKTKKEVFILGTASTFARKAVRIANRVYANRMGNGLEASGDGYKYRGRGFIQLTGKSNYQSFKNDSGIDVINNPDLLLEEANAMICAIWFWNNKGLNIWADQDDISSVTKKINGGINGLEDRKRLLNKYKSELL